MSVAQEILTGAQIAEKYTAAMAQAELHEKLGFLTVEDLPIAGLKPSPRQIMLVGFANAGWQFGDDVIRDRIDPIVDYTCLPSDLHIAARHLKGVGPRIYNTAQALGGTAEDPLRVDIFAFLIQPNNLCDERASYDRTLPGMALRALRYKLLERRAGKQHEHLSEVVAEVHQRQGKVDAILLNQTPDAALKQWRHHRPPSPVPEELLIIRNPRIIAKKIGDYHR